MTWTCSAFLCIESISVEEEVRNNFFDKCKALRCTQIQRLSELWRVYVKFKE